MSQSFPSIQYNQATIVNSGSTNTSGFRIAVKRSGAAEYASIPRGAGAQNKEPETSGREIPNDLTSRLFADLEAAKPLASLPAPHCMKSRSFGTRLTVEFGGETTPDLSCGDGGNEHLRALITDVNEMVALFRAK
ncbi:MAG TPA: hypothetical protein VG345_13285 [Bryobacteraceae bacterium]|nr:hypothetical protein [Bryobacteraceae bacterium]